MPFIHIRSLPLKESPAIDRVIKGVLKDFADRTGVEPRHIHVTWEFFLPGHYAKGADSPAVQPESGHPLIVDLLTPDFNDQERVLLMLQSTAESLSKRAGVPIDNIFINHRQARSGMVFDDGKPVFW